MKFLISTKEVYRVESENAVQTLIDEAKNDGRYIRMVQSNAG